MKPESGRNHAKLPQEGMITGDMERGGGDITLPLLHLLSPETERPKTGSKSQLHHRSARRHWTRYLMCLSLNSLIYEMGVTIKRGPLAKSSEGPALENGSWGYKHCPIPHLQAS